MMYKANRGGHAPGHLRQALFDWLDAWPFGGWKDFDHAKFWPPTVDGRICDLRWLWGQLWNCTDILPSEYCSVLDLPQGSTFAQASRKIAAEVESMPVDVDLVDIDDV